MNLKILNHSVIPSKNYWFIHNCLIEMIACFSKLHRSSGSICCTVQWQKWRSSSRTATFAIQWMFHVPDVHPQELLLFFSALCFSFLFLFFYFFSNNFAAFLIIIEVKGVYNNINSCQVWCSKHVLKANRQNLIKVFPPSLLRNL